MEEKKGIFSFFKGISKIYNLTDEEIKQRDYALAQERNNSEDDVAVATDAVVESNISDEYIEFCKEKMGLILELAGFPSEIKTRINKEQTLVVEIVNDDDLGRIIGKDGNTLLALQILIRQMCNHRFTERNSLVVDAGGYLSRRQDSIHGQAKRAARDVMQKNIKVELKPMNAAERRMVHMIFQDDKRIRSYSIGEGKDRRIVLEKQTYGANAL